MNILLTTPVFKPMVGGMETLADNFAVHFTKRGHRVTVVTPVAATEPDEAIYAIVRRPSPVTFLRLAKQADIIFSNGASLLSAPWAILTGTPVVMRHTGYQVNSIDGAGWYVGRPAPLRPLASFRFHLRHGTLRNTLRGVVKVGLLRLFAKRGVAANVAISDWMKTHHPLPNQLRIHNPFPISKFQDVLTMSRPVEYDFFFLGRLISEKGVDVLLRALARLNTGKRRYRLCVIGDGPERRSLEALAQQLGVAADVHFAGMQTKAKLLEFVARARIAVLPSTWEEPFGGVATELLAAGKNMIVSRNGALSEIVADAGLTFKNGHDEDLSRAMLRLVTDEDLQQKQLEAAKERLRDFDEEALIDQYLKLFNALLRPKPTTSPSLGTAHSTKTTGFNNFINHTTK